MTITSTPSEITYSGDGVSTVFTIPFVFDTSIDLKVVETTAGVPTVVTTGFSIAGGAGLTGTLTRSVALPAGTNLLILDNPALTQPVDYVDNDAFPAATHEAALDRVTRITKRLNERVDRSLRVADGDLIDGDNNLLPISTARANKFMAFDASGRPTISAGTGGGDSSLRADLANGLTGPGSTLVAIKRTAAEITAGKTPTIYDRDELDPRRYASISDWTAVFNQIDTLAESYATWYRVDRAQHPTLTNCIVGFQAYNDAAMTATVGYRCTAFGVWALKSNSASVTAGGSNTAIGYQSMRDSVEISGNTGVGTSTLASCTGVLSSHNGAFGNSCLEALVTGTQNNAFSYRAMYQLVRGDNNTGMGDVVLQGLIAGNANACFGAQAGFTKPGGNYLCAYGYQACFHENAALISAITRAASAVVTLSTVSGSNPYVVNDYVTFSDVGGMTQINLLAGIVTAIGGASGAWTVTVAIDSSAFSVYTSGGYLAPHGNVGFGYKTQFENVYASGNTTVGTESASTAALGAGNSLFGFQAGRVINGASFNSVFGWRAGLALSSGVGNCLFGQKAALALTTGVSNAVFGDNAAAGQTTGTHVTAVGSGAAATGNWNNVVALGYNAQPIADNTITLGDANIIQIRAQVTTITALSDARFKKNIRALELPEGALEDLQPVVFEWIAEGVAPGPQMGFIAQALDEWQTKWGLEWMELVSKTNPDRLEATPGKLLFPLIAHVQRQDSRMAALEARLAALEAK